MLSVAKCRNVLQVPDTVPDDEVLAARDQLYALAHALLDIYPPASQDLEIMALSDDARMEIEERAAIFEFDAGMSRREAESRALKTQRSEVVH